MFLHYKHADGTSFDIEKYPDFNDYFDYLKPNDYDSYDDGYKNGYREAMKDAYTYDLFDYLDEDEDFIEFMTDRNGLVKMSLNGRLVVGNENEVEDHE